MKQLFVIRLLVDTPVVTGVVNQNELTDNEMLHRADEIINRFVQQFPEFKNAKWFKQFSDQGYLDVRDF